jgi:hypothetical protein
MTLLLAVVSASAQATPSISVKVPFPFVTAGKTWPDADYRVEIRPEVGILTLSSPGGATATMLTTPDARSGEKHASLRFQCSGDEWVLQEVILDGTARILPLGELEKEPATPEPTCREMIGAGGLAIY